MTDAAKLHDIARNLVENAVNYTPDGGAIDVSAADEGRPVSADGRRIPVTASRRMISARVFERFYRVDKSRTRPGGTGLGLSIVKHLVHVLDGEVTASNQAGGGRSSRSRCRSASSRVPRFQQFQGFVPAFHRSNGWNLGTLELTSGTVEPWNLGTSRVTSLLALRARRPARAANGNMPWPGPRCATSARTASRATSPCLRDR